MTQLGLIIILSLPNVELSWIRLNQTLTLTEIKSIQTQAKCLKLIMILINNPSVEIYFQFNLQQFNFNYNIILINGNKNALSQLKECSLSMSIRTFIGSNGHI